MTYQFYRLNPATYQSSPGPRITFRVTGIVDIPPGLVDQSDEQEGGVLPPAATRQLLPYYVFSWVGVRLDHGTAGIGALQHHLTSLAAAVQRQYSAAAHRRLDGLAFAIARSDTVRREVQQAIGPQVVALTVFGAIAALAMLVLAGQDLAQLMSRTSPDISVLRALGGARPGCTLAERAGSWADSGDGRQARGPRDDPRTRCWPRRADTRPGRAAAWPGRA